MQIIQLTPSKQVRISQNSDQVNAMLVQNYKGESDVIEAKTFSNLKNAIRWADKLSFQN